MAQLYVEWYELFVVCWCVASGVCMCMRHSVIFTFVYSEFIIATVQLFFTALHELCVAQFGRFTFGGIIPWLNLTRRPYRVHHSCYDENAECNPKYESPFLK